MRNFEIKEGDHNVFCGIYADKSQKIKSIVVYGHGFAGHKENAAAMRFAERVLDKYKGVAVVVYDLPCHGQDVKKKLTLDDCLAYMKIVTDYAKNSLGAEKIYYYGTSFGGYLALLCLEKFGSPFEKLALRCPAVYMYGTTTENLMKADDFDKLKKGKSAFVGFDRKIEITSAYLNELKENDIRKSEFFDHADAILIIQGLKDELVHPEDVRQFADDNAIEFVEIPNADHRFTDPKCMESATKSVLAFFDL